MLALDEVEEVTRCVDRTERRAGVTSDTARFVVTESEGQMSDKSSGVSSGIGFPGLLTVAFIVLKLCGVITWSWWWVWSPLWIGVVGVVVAALAAFIFISFK